MKYVLSSHYQRHPIRSRQQARRPCTMFKSDRHQPSDQLLLSVARFLRTAAGQPCRAVDRHRFNPFNASCVLPNVDSPPESTSKTPHRVPPRTSAGRTASPGPVRRQPSRQRGGPLQGTKAAWATAWYATTDDRSTDWRVEGVNRRSRRRGAESATLSRNGTRRNHQNVRNGERASARATNEEYGRAAQGETSKLRRLH